LRGTARGAAAGSPPRAPQFSAAAEDEDAEPKETQEEKRKRKQRGKKARQRANRKAKEAADNAAIDEMAADDL